MNPSSIAKRETSGKSRNIQKQILRQTVRRIINAKARGNVPPSLKNNFVTVMKSLYPYANNTMPYQAFHDIVLLHTPQMHRTILMNATTGAPEDPRTHMARRLINHLRVTHGAPFRPNINVNFNLNKFLKSRNLKP